MRNLDNFSESFRDIVEKCNGAMFKDFGEIADKLHMKNLKSCLNYNLLFLPCALLALSSCANPFDLKAIEKEVTGTISTGTLKAATNIVSGGSAPVVTSGGYKVTNSVGVLSTLPKVTTSSGYKVSSSLNSD